MEIDCLKTAFFYEYEKIKSYLKVVNKIDKFQGQLEVLKKNIFLIIFFLKKMKDIERQVVDWFFFYPGYFFCRWWNIVIFQLVQIMQGCFYCILATGTFCKYSEKYEPEHVPNQKKYFFERFIKIYMLNQWKFCYLKGVFEKIDMVNLMVNSTPFIVKNNAPLDYLAQLTEC